MLEMLEMLEIPLEISPLWSLSLMVDGKAKDESS
jgi:hypothetical protein